jgi:glucose-1-phosphate adenylyltransferase
VIDPASLLSETVTMVLAGGQGERLYPLTRDRAKPAVPFGGVYRIIDFTLSNCANSGARRIYLLTQYRSLSLDRHIRQGWSIFNPELNEFIATVPPQQRMTTQFYLGTADAIYENIYILQSDKPRYVLVLSGDHVYRMDYRKLVEHHAEKGADVTVACVEMDVESARDLGVAVIDSDQRIVQFHEKPERPTPVPGRTNVALCNMGVYVFTTEVLVRAVIEDAKRDTQHDFGRNVIPDLVHRAKVHAYLFRDEATGWPGYWRDIGTLDSYYEANMDLVADEPTFDLYDATWPLRTNMGQGPPAKLVALDRNVVATDSFISAGCVIDRATVRRSILSPNVRVSEGASVEECIIFHGAAIGEGVVLRRAIVDARVSIPRGVEIGTDPERDRRNFTVSEGGVSVVPRVAPQIGIS